MHPFSPLQCGSTMFGSSRGGVRGGQDQFKWEDVKTDKQRENYLGNSLMAPVGRWQKGKDLTWYAKEKKGDASLSRAEELNAELAEVCKRNEGEADEKSVDRLMGLGSSRNASGRMVLSKEDKEAAKLGLSVRKVIKKSKREKDKKKKKKKKKQKKKEKKKQKKEKEKEKDQRKRSRRNRPSSPPRAAHSSSDRYSRDRTSMSPSKPKMDDHQHRSHRKYSASRDRISESRKRTQGESLEYHPAKKWRGTDSNN
ncbi:hypothetical protein E2320_001476 [Naja naja]|nr:hypothetical protein E2320_001476 [Naja naja]